MEKKFIQLKPGLLYNPQEDSYRFDTDHPEKLGPISVGLQVTRRCNANCVHCAASDMTAEVDTKQMLEIVENLVAGGTVRFSVTGGEPLMRSDLLQILAKIKDLGAIATLSTNSFGLGRKKMMEIRKYLTNIRFSLHGLKETNDYVFQRKGAFNHILKQIDLANEVGLSVSIINSVMKRNAAQLPELMTILEEKGVKKLIIFTLMSAGRGQEIYNDQFISSSEMKTILAEMEQIKQQSGMDIEVNLVDWRLEGQCIIVDPTGVMFAYDPTQAHSSLILGNVLEQDVAKLWSEYPYKNNYLDYYRSH